MSRPARSPSSSITRARLPWRLALGLSLGALLGLACAQGEGDRCERDGDCKAGLICMKSSNTPSGRCTSGTGTVVPDAAIEAAPMSQPEAGADKAPVVDVPAADTAGPDLTVDTAPADVRADGGAG
jgi:hypothetical protein